jgi:sugar phosphate isomerase/epimerase
MKVHYGKLALALLATVLISGCATTRERTVGTGAGFDGPLGLQLYSLRSNFNKGDIEGTLAKVRAFGFKYVELAGTYKMTPAAFSQSIERHGLVAISGHFPFDRFRDEPEKVAEEAKALGLKFAGCAWIPHQDPFTEKAARDAAAVFNRAGEVLKQHGIRLFYHTHGYEFQPHQNGTLFDLLIQETKPEFVTYEMDVFWIVHPNHDPAKLLDKYPKRFELMHVKDMKRGTEHNLTGKSNVNNDVAIGAGVMEWPAILAAAERAGVKWYFIEDESDAVEHQIPQSIKFLEQIRY